MLSRVGRARGLSCLFLFMALKSNRLQNLAVGPNPGTARSMAQKRWPVQSCFCDRRRHATRESNSCREAAQSNEALGRSASSAPVT